MRIGKSITTTKGASTIQQLSYDWDAQLNLKSRTDALQPQNKTERFRHDVLDRLTCAYFSPMENANAACDSSFGYAPNGNLTTKSDIGSLLYADPAHPHAVTNAGGGVYGHDAVGNQITRPGVVGITYTAFDLPKTITQGAKTVSFGYDGDQQRIRKTTSNSETLSFGDLFEQVTTAGVKEYRYYVHSPERTIAIVTRGGNEPGTKYLHVDHLGSTETITKDDGKVDEKRSYDAFGARRHVQWGLPGGAFASKTKKGFTGHDEEDEFGLVNMKGRLYDPRIARFTTTDPVIANVFDGQSFAAYSYVLNNPLTFVDPTGFAPETKLEVFPDSDMIEQTVITNYPDDFVPDPLPEEIRESTSSLRFAADVGTMGDGAETVSDQGASNGLDIMGDVLGGAASAYARDVFDHATGMALMLTLPQVYFAWQGYNFWSGVAGGAYQGYRQDGAFGAFAGAVNAVNPFAHVGISLAETVDSAEKGDYKQAGVYGYHAVVGIAGIFAAAVGVAIGNGGGAGRGGNRLRPDPSATGAHTSFRLEPGTNRVTHYETYKPKTNPNHPAPWESVKRVDMTGSSHYNKALQEYVPTPHVQAHDILGGVRAALPNEIPLGW